MREHVPADRVEEAMKSLKDVAAIATASRKAGVPFHLACALVQQESGDGSNVWGGYDNSPFAGLDVRITKDTFEVYYFAVLNGVTPTGVGPLQITWAGKLVNGRRDGGLYRLMLEQGLKPWIPADNILFGLRELRRLRDLPDHRSWRKALASYNGGPSTPNYGYADEVLEKDAAWRERFGQR